HHVVITADALVYHIYIDGVSKTMTMGAGKPNNGAFSDIGTVTSSKIGAQTPLSAYVLGSLDDFRFYNRGLSVEEVTSLYQGSELVTPSFSTKDISISGGTLIPPATTTVSGNWSQSGTGVFNANGGTVILNGINQFITGTTTFANLVKTVTSADTLTFGAGQTTTATGTVTLQGASGNLLSLRSSSSSAQWLFDPQGARNFSYIDVQDSWNINAVGINGSSIPGIRDSGNNTGWGIALAVVTLSATGTQQATTTIPATNQYLGGAFTAGQNAGTSNVTSITLTQKGSLNADTYLSNLRLYSTSTVNGVCPLFSASYTAFNGTGVAFSGNRATTTGTLAVGTIPICIYARFDVAGSMTEALIGNSIDLEVTNPSTDIIASGVTVVPATAVNISGATILVTSSVTNGDTSTSTISSTLSLKMADADKNPTVFYVKDNALWMKQGTGAPQRLTAETLFVTGATFINLGGPSGSVKVQLRVKKKAVDGSVQNYTLEKTFTTSATVRKK
ncbi:MAG: LamG-like jellyroll fold domain-containing protein, partial [Candidatus Paceibacterota bacterium]